MQLRIIVATLFCTSLMIPVMSWAQETNDEQEFQTALQDLGISAGYAMQCVRGAKAKTNLIASQADLIGGGLLKEFGSQSAFRFMVYFGIGNAEQINKDECAHYVADWNKFTAQYPGLPQLK